MLTAGRTALVAVLVGAAGVLLVPSPAAALPPPGGGPTGASATADLERRIAKLLPSRIVDSRLGTDVAVQVRAADGSILFSAHSGEAQMPASNMKLVTALGALTSLGPDRVLSTRVLPSAGGGGVVLVGGGDPLLSSANLDALAVRTAATMTGGGMLKVYADNGPFRDTTLAPGWRSSYVPGEVTFVRGLARHGVMVTNTAKDAGTYFAARLTAHGVRATYVGGGTGNGASIASVSHTVAQAVSVMLQVSDNQVAETLFRHVAMAEGRPATWSGGSAAAMAVLRDHGITTAGLRLYDGSGLSRSDRLTARALAQLLTVVRARSHPALAGFLGWLPVGGRSGTLAASNGRFTTSPSRCAAGRVQAKTGTLTGALALSGVAVGTDGTSRVFSIIVNHPPTSRYSVLTVRRAIDGLAATVTGCW